MVFTLIKNSLKEVKIRPLFEALCFWTLISLIIIVAIETLLIPTDIVSRLFKISGLYGINSLFLIKIFGTNFTIASFIIFVISVFTLYFVLLELARGSHLNSIIPGIPKISQILLLYFILGSLLSIFFGLIDPQPEFSSNFRNILSLGLFFFFIKNINRDNEIKVSKIVLVVLFFVSIFSALSFLVPPFANWYSQYVVTHEKVTTFQSRMFSVSTGAWSINAGTMALLLYSLALSRLLFVGISLKWLVLCCLGAIGGLAFIGKVNVFIFIVITILFLGTIINQNKKYFYRLISLFILIFFCLIGIPLVKSEIFFNERISFIQSYFTQGYLNINRGELTGDLSSGRFEIWRLYALDSLNGFGMAPYGFGNVLDERKTAHNMILHFAYHVGIIPTIALVIAIAVLLYNIFKKSIRLLDTSRGWRAIGYLFFFCGFLAQSMVSTNWFAYKISFFGFLSLALAMGSVQKTCSKYELDPEI
jgi:hypothetical protein